MGTRGWWCFRFNGVYYRIFANYDSYFDHLGANIVSEIRHDGKLELVGKWRRLFELGVVTWKDDVDGQLTPPPHTEEQPDPLTTGTSSTNPRTEWDDIINSLPPLENHVVSRWFRGMYSPYCHEDREVTVKRSFFKDADTPMLKFGYNIFVEYIYLIDLDNNEFSALDVPYGSSETLIYRWPFADIPEDWISIASKSTWTPNLTVEAFPLPDVINLPMQRDMKSNGYDECDHDGYWNFFNLWNGLRVFKDRRTGRDCAINIFFPVGDKEEEKRGPRAVGVTDVLMKYPHPSIVPILSNTRLGDCPAVVYGHYEKNLTELNSQDPNTWLNIYSQVAKGIIHLHKLGIVHDLIEPRSIKYQERKEGNTTYIDAMISYFDCVCVPFLHHHKRHPYRNRRAKPVKSNLFRSLSWGPYKEANLRCCQRDEEDDAISDDEEVSIELHHIDDKLHAYDKFHNKEEEEAKADRNRDRQSRRYDLVLKRAHPPTWEKGWESRGDAASHQVWFTDSNALGRMMTKNKILFPDGEKQNSIARGAVDILEGYFTTTLKEQDMSYFEVAIGRLERFVEYLKLNIVWVDVRHRDDLSTCKRKDPPSQLQKEGKPSPSDHGDNKRTVQDA